LPLRRNFKTTGRWYKSGRTKQSGYQLKIPNPACKECPVNTFVRLDQQEEISIGQYAKSVEENNKRYQEPTVILKQAIEVKEIKKTTKKQ
jgi:hypothetical protein